MQILGVCQVCTRKYVPVNLSSIFKIWTWFKQRQKIWLAANGACQYLLSNVQSIYNQRDKIMMQWSVEQLLALDYHYCKCAAS